jgi:hypothetical protein
MPISPTAEGFRAAFRRPSLALGEITWRWAVGATAIVLFFFGLSEYLSTLPVTNGELLFLRTRHPYFVAQALAHIFRGSLNRAVMSLLLAALLLAVLWIVAASLGRIATVGVMLAFVRERFAGKSLDNTKRDEDKNAAHAGSRSSSFITLMRLNFLRAVLVLVALVGLAGAMIVAGFASPDANPRPGLAFLLFVPMAAVIFLLWCGLNWLLSLAAVFAVRDREDAVGAISAAVALCRDRSPAVFAVSTWTGLAHLGLFVGATTVLSFPLGMSGVLPWRVVALGVILVTLAYFAVADWLYTARLAGYVCIVEVPDVLLHPLPPIMPPQAAEPLQTTIDRNELILSDVPGLAQET